MSWLKKLFRRKFIAYSHYNEIDSVGEIEKELKLHGYSSYLVKLNGNRRVIIDSYDDRLKMISKLEYERKLIIKLKMISEQERERKLVIKREAAMRQVMNS